MTEEKIKACPFCGGRVAFAYLFLSHRLFYCMNTETCGAVVDFENPAVNRSEQWKICAWNRRAAEERSQTNEDGNP